MMSKKVYFGTNLKMYKGNNDTIDYLSELSQVRQQLPSEYDIELFVIPSYIALKDAITTVTNSSSQHGITIGAQNMNPHDRGQFTGEISPVMLKELGVQLVMIGHSERRHIFKESDQDENEKVVSALKHGFKTLLCIGETLTQKNTNTADEALRVQLKVGLQSVANDAIENLWIAYEPVWAIGENGIPATSDYANEKHGVIKECLFELFGDASKKIPVLYGGSVNLENANELILQSNIDGLFVGRSAWEAKSFHLLMKNALNTLSTKNVENEFTDVARQLIKQLGGIQNISALSHCASRIRVIINNESHINKPAIEKITGVNGLFSIANQYQIIVGPKAVEGVYCEMKRLL